MLPTCNGGFVHAGDVITVWRNQGEREAVVLAVLGEEVLLEYEMPNGTSALSVVSPCSARPDGERYAAVPYAKLSERWVEAIRRQWGTEPHELPYLVGNPQKSPTRGWYVPVEGKHLRCKELWRINQWSPA